MQKLFHKESGNVVIIVLVVLAIAVVGILAYLSGQNTKGAEDNTAAVAMSGQSAQLSEGQPGQLIEPGNPVVAKVGDEEITRVEVFNFIQTLPEQTRQLPIAQLFPVALNQVVNSRVIQQNTKNVRIDSDPLVKERVAAAKENIVRDVYVQRQVEKKVTDERLKGAYDQYVENFPEITEVKARHILVKENSVAKELIAQLQAGGDFAELAKANSTDGTAQNGGEIGYFSQADVVPAFADAAFALEPGAYTENPVETEFGFHVIQVEEKRQRPPATLEQAMPFLEGQLNQAALSELINEWREKATVESFDINGRAIEPTGGVAAPVDAQ